MDQVAAGLQVEHSKRHRCAYELMAEELKPSEQMDDLTYARLPQLLTKGDLTYQTSSSEMS